MLDAFFSWLLSWRGSIPGDDVFATLDYFTNGKHLAWYASVRYTLAAALFGAVFAVFFGLVGTGLKRSRFIPFRLLGNLYTTIVRGVPDLLFILFLPLALEQLVEYIMAQSHCSPAEMNSDSWPPCASAQWYLGTTEHLVMACLSLGLVYGAFTANVIHGAMDAVSRAQLEAASAYGFSSRQIFWRFHIRQMWVYALPGLSNVWMLILKATSFLSLLQIADIVQWAGRLGAANYLPRVGMVHPDWRWKYYLALVVFYIIMAVLSDHLFKYLYNRASRGLQVIR